MNLWLVALLLGSNLGWWLRYRAQRRYTHKVALLVRSTQARLDRLQGQHTQLQQQVLGTTKSTGIRIRLVRLRLHTLREQVAHLV